MNDALQKAAVKRCASELVRAIWYYRAWKALQVVERDVTANFIYLAEIAMHDQMIANAAKVLSINKTTGKGEKAGFWGLHKVRRNEVDCICERLRIDLGAIRSVGEKLKVIRDKTHFHLDLIGVLAPKSIWHDANITHDQFDAALSSSFNIIGELHFLIMGKPFETWNYDGSDAKVIAEHADKHQLLYRDHS
jgi:hypothetical protein